MKIVGDYLIDQYFAHSANDIDLFARSALNRYYYHCFLLIRKEIVSFLGTKSGDIKHQSISGLLSGDYQIKIRRNLPTPKQKELSSYIKIISSNIKILQTIREAADYHDIKFNKAEEVFNFVVEYKEGTTSLSRTLNQIKDCINTIDTCLSNVRTLKIECGL